MTGPRHTAPLRAVRSQETLAGRLQEKRLLAGLSQTQLAGVLGCSQQTVGKWEGGQRPDAKYYSKLMDYLGLEGKRDLMKLLEVDRHETEVPADEVDAGSELAQTLVMAWADRIRSGKPLMNDDLAAFTATAQLIRDLSQSD